MTYSIAPRQLTELTLVHVLSLDGKFVAQSKKESNVENLKTVLVRENVTTHEGWQSLPWNPYRLNFITCFCETNPILPREKI